MTSWEDYVERAENCLADARKEPDRNTRINLRQKAAKWVKMAERAAAAKRAAIADETG